jgi:cytidylate kinase
MRKIIIAIDGPAGSGKTSTAKILSQKLNYIYIDTGAMYRAITLA